jgi:hypothetical protein
MIQNLHNIESHEWGANRHGQKIRRNYVDTQTGHLDHHRKLGKGCTCALILTDSLETFLPPEGFGGR